MNESLIATILTMTGLSVLFSVVLGVASKKLKVEEDPLVNELTHLLAGVNCGACGSVSCHAFAENIVNEGVDPGKCRVVDEDTTKKLYELIGKEGNALNPILPVVQCAAKWEHKKPPADYKGVRTCAAANLDFGGGMECQYGCMGFGDCVTACAFGALKMVDGLPVLEAAKCTGCTLCAKACPRDIISMQEKDYDKLIFVACSTHDGPLRVRKICSVGCIACGICVKLGPEGYFEVKDNLSRPDYSKQGDQEKILILAAKCPTKVIKNM